MSLLKLYLDEDVRPLLAEILSNRPAKNFAQAFSFSALFKIGKIFFDSFYRFGI